MQTSRIKQSRTEQVLSRVAPRKAKIDALTILTPVGRNENSTWWKDNKQAKSPDPRGSAEGLNRRLNWDIR